MNQKEKLGKVTAKGARFSRIGAMSTGSKIAMGILALIVLASVLSPFISPYGPDQIFDKWSAPSGEHLFGTDHVGRDILARVLYGGRFSLLIGLCSTLIALFFGAIIGSIAAVVRKSFSEAIMRVMDIVMAVPGIAMAAVSVLVFGRTLSKSGNTFGLVLVIICSIAFVYIPQLSRIVRANVMAAYGEDYVRAVIVSGARAPWILTKHVMRNTAAPVLVFADRPRRRRDHPRGLPDLHRCRASRRPPWPRGATSCPRPRRTCRFCWASGGPPSSPACSS